MKSWIKTLGICMGLFFVSDLSAQPFEELWKTADSLQRRGLPQSADSVVRQIEQQARDQGLPFEGLKASVYQIGLAMGRDEDPWKQAIDYAQQQIERSGIPERSIWQSLTAELFWQYYQQHRWKMHDQGPIDRDSRGADISYWDAHAFGDQILALYLASLQPGEKLSNWTLNDIEPMVVEGKNRANTRPYLYDLLAQRALDYLGNPDAQMLHPKDPSLGIEKTWFDPLDSFLVWKPKLETSRTGVDQARAIFQQWLGLHQKKRNMKALRDLDMERGRWAYERARSRDSRTEYMAALRRWESKYAGLPEGGLARMRRLQIVMDAATWEIPEPGAIKDTLDWVRMVAELEDLKRRFPRDEAGTLAHNALQQIQRRRWGVRIPEVILPGENQALLLEYRNLRQLRIRLYAMDPDSFLALNSGLSSSWQDWTQRQKPRKTWELELPGKEDHRAHRSEWILEALTPGAYLIQVEPAFDSLGDAQGGLVPFQVSRMALIQSRDGDFRVMDREKGIPLSGVRLQAVARPTHRLPSPVDPWVAQSDESGRLPMDKTRRERVHIKLTKGEDVLVHSVYKSTPPSESERTLRRSFFYTDRSIYQPGERVSFKAIILDQASHDSDHRLIQSQPTRIDLMDAQGQLVDSFHGQTNAFGSVSGSFVLPKGRMNGQYWIRNAWGGVTFSVESYQPPKFFIKIDSLQEPYGLGDSVLVTGIGQRYEGSALAHQKGNYRVKRKSFFGPFLPWSRAWLPFPQRSEDWAQGPLETDEQGRFAFGFRAEGEEGMAEGEPQIYYFEVEVSLTDFGGETQTSQKTWPLGTVSVLADLDLPRSVSRADLDTVEVRLTHLSGTPVSLPYRLKIHALDPPASLRRPRIWPAPDRPLYDSLYFVQHLPRDEYGRESDPAFWPKGALIWDQAYAEPGSVALPADSWDQNGTYVFELTFEDPQTGKPHTERKIVELWDPGKPSLHPFALVTSLPSRVHLGDTLRVQVHTDFPNVAIVEQRFGPKGKQPETLRSPEDPGRNLRRLVEAEDQGGLGFQYTLIYQNRLYTRHHFIDVPYANRQLEVEWIRKDSLLRPGDTARWAIQVKAPTPVKGEAEWALTLYDYSLDALRPHDWKIPNIFPSRSFAVHWTALGFSPRSDQGWDKGAWDYWQYEAYYPRLMTPWEGRGGMGLYPRTGMMLMDGMQVQESRAASPPPEALSKTASLNQDQEEGPTQAGLEKEEKPQIRRDFRQTAFFIPQVRTGKDGTLYWEFQVPESLTEWKLMGLVHNQDLQFGLASARVVTQKSLMVDAGLPVFFRQGDQIEIEARVTNKDCGDGPTQVYLEVLDPDSRQSLGRAFGLREPEGEIWLTAEETGSYRWSLSVPEARYQPVAIQVRARRGVCQDGEEHVIPVLSRRVLVTETLPLWIHGAGKKSFFWPSLHEKQRHPQRTDHQLSLEYYSDPLWMIMGTLPFLAEPRFRGAEALFGQVYAGRLGQEILRLNPALADQIRALRDTEAEALTSPLQKHPDLKSLLLHQTPWVGDAESEKQRMQELSLLMHQDTLEQREAEGLRQLLDMQGQDGGLPWFPGMPSDRFITQTILSGIGKAESRHPGPWPAAWTELKDRALAYVDGAIDGDFQRLKKTASASLRQQHLGSLEVQYLYTRSFFSPSPQGSTREAWNYYLGQAETYWQNFSPQVQAMIAIALHRAGRQSRAEAILASLKETSLYSEEMGRYWKRPTHPFSWTQAPVLTQARIMEAFQAIRPNDEALNEMAIWLIKQKETRHWPSSMGTADAVFVLLGMESSKLGAQLPRVEIRLGEERVVSKPAKSAPSGSFFHRWDGTAIDTSWARIELEIEGAARPSSWGALYWQYFDQLDQVTNQASGVQIRRELMVERRTPEGVFWKALKEGEPIARGERVRVRLLLEADRDMDYVHIQDGLATPFVPEQTLSGYRWSNGLGYYQTAEETAQHFFLSRFPKGKYLLEYEIRARQAGTFDLGLALIECLYAPAFRGHSSSGRIQVVYPESESDANLQGHK